MLGPLDEVGLTSSYQSINTKLLINTFINNVKIIYKKINKKKKIVSECEKIECLLVVI